MTTTDPDRRERLALLAILLVALALRVAHWLSVRDEPFVASLVVDSREYERWAQGIVAGDWLGRDAFFQAPLYPYFVAALHLLFGKTLHAIYLVQSVAAVLGCWALYRAGRLMVSGRVGLLAALLLGILSPCIFHDVLLLKESLAVSVSCFLLWSLAAARIDGAPKRWLCAGLLLGILALLRENALLLAPLLAALPFVPASGGTREAPSHAIHAALALIVGVLLTLAPVAARNGIVSGDWLPTTSQGGVNLYIGNHAGASGAYDALLPGPHDPARERQAAQWLAERESGRALSPAEVSSFWASRAIDWALTNPADFARLLGHKAVRYWRFYEQPDAVDYYWMQARSPVLGLPLLEFGGACILAAAGIGMAFMRRRVLDLAPAWWFALGWMLSTILFFVFSRYRLPTAPALLLFAAIPVDGLLRAASLRQIARTILLTALVLLAFLVPRAMGYGPRMDAVHLNLASIATDEGRWDDAKISLTAALEFEGARHLARLQLGLIAVQERDWPAAERHLAEAVGLAPRSSEAKAALGRVLLTQGRVAEAERHLQAAVAIDPSSADALHDLSVAAAMRGDFERAKSLNARVLALRPDDPVAQQLQQQLGERP